MVADQLLKTPSTVSGRTEDKLLKVPCYPLDGTISFVLLASFMSPIHIQTSQLDIRNALAADFANVIAF